MKFTVVLALVAAATVVSASTNAERLARGLSPNAPGKRATPVLRARHGSPSGTSKCSTGPVHCCDSLEKAGSGGRVDSMMSQLGIHAAPGVLCGANCSPITAVGAGGNHCSSQTVCCENNHFNGLVNVGCTPVNVNL